ncbi:MAG: tRNA dihydrouridine(20/20a) synthase DusA [Betaproteobacteria bacterium]|nr:tRNA dihydrouridine(20/20a) synthase DusA [Betaproteobacteria bacterium]NBY05962.1 tRNA dihydrouridine(20/20a) synthase DusA [Betaproteobacteria bacterium]
MMDWTDRHCRFFHRLISRRAWLYTEMVTTGALLHGDVARHLDHDPFEHPVALQIGGCEASELAKAARLGQRWGYQEINLNCGCPSERVQKGAFGACLMADPTLVADGIKAMQDSVELPISVKHRIGLDHDESPDMVTEFVGQIYDVGCRMFIVHARNAWLKGLSPKQNREVPPLRYAVVHRLKQAFPDAQFVLNGGLHSLADIERHTPGLDGAMVGRAAYHNPWTLSGWDAWLDQTGRLAGVSGPVASSKPAPSLDRDAVELAMVGYMTEQQRSAGVHWYSMARHILGLRHGMPGARLWRQVWSDHRLKHLSPTEVHALAQQALRRHDPVVHDA